MGRAVIRNVGLYNLPPAYEESNYHPQAEYRPFMQYGAWCQLWATTAGQGRVLAFADSTLFSNFCVYQPGKSELFMGMLEWLNHSSRWDAAGLQWCLLVGMCLACGVSCTAAVWGVRAGRGRWLLLLACGWMAWACTAQVVQGLQRRAMPVPDKTHSMQYVVIDRTLSDVPLFTGAFADATDGVGYGMLEQWIPRVGNYISRRSGFEAFEGDGLVVICPTNMPGPEYRERLIEWVRAGGRLIVLDTPDVENSTANSLLMLFGLTSVHNAPTQKDTPLRLVTGDAQTPLQATCEIVGGEPLAKWGEVVTAARVPYGQGTVTAVGFGSLFNDASMGYHWLQEPDETQLQRYEILYALFAPDYSPLRHSALQVARCEWPVGWADQTGRSWTASDRRVIVVSSLRDDDAVVALEAPASERLSYYREAAMPRCNGSVRPCSRGQCSRRDQSCFPFT